MKTKNLIKAVLIFAVIFTSCTHDNEVLDPLQPVPPGPGISDKELVAKNVTTAPVIDGAIDAGLNDAPMLRTTVTVPDPGNQVFRGYEGNTNDVTLRALYDNDYIYFLAEWTDNELSLNRQTLYFDPDESLWKQ